MAATTSSHLAALSQSGLSTSAACTCMQPYSTAKYKIEANLRRIDVSTTSGFHSAAKRHTTTAAPRFRMSPCIPFRCQRPHSAPRVATLAVQHPLRAVMTARSARLERKSGQSGHDRPLRPTHTRPLRHLPSLWWPSQCVVIEYFRVMQSYVTLQLDLSAFRCFGTT